MEGNSEQVVFVVDDDESMRAALTYLFQSMNLHVEVFSRATAFLESELPSIASCLVLDIRLPGVNGLEFQGVLAGAGIHIPIDFLPKPFHDQDMLDAVMRALDQDRKRRDEEKAVSQLRHLFESLTRREREVLPLVISGLMNKQIAHRLEISEITVKIHRGQVMKKMEARSLADLVRMAEMLGIKRTN